MMGRTHFAAGVAVSAASLHYLPLEQAGLFTAGCLIGSLTPDVDHPASKLGSKLPIISHIIFYGLGHRGGTHSILFLLIVSYLISLIDVYAGYGMGLGILSHLVLDMVSYGGGRWLSLNGAGVPALFPIKKRLGIRIFVVNGIFENLIILPALYLCCFALMATYLGIDVNSIEHILVNTTMYLKELISR